MTDACGIAHRLIEQREDAAWFTSAADLLSCSRLEIMVTLYEHEQAGVRPSSWPAPVLRQVEGHVEKWLAQHPERAVCAVTYAAPRSDGRQCCVMILHHRPRESA